MSNNFRDQLLAKTAGVVSTAERKPDSTKKLSRTETAPGMAGHVVVLQERVRELEQAGVASKIKVAAIVPNPWQPRRVFNEAKLTDLAESIREVGLLQSIVVRKVGDTYQIVAGERRWRAHKMVGLEDIKATVMECSDADMAVLAIVENITRDDLLDYEIALAVKKSESEFPNKKRLAEAMGLSRTGLYRYLSFSNLPTFIQQDLDIQPHLLGGTAAQDIVAVLTKYGEAGLKAAKELWPSVTRGDLDQLKFAPAIASQVKRGDASVAANERNIDKFFSGGEHAGSITKDTSNFTVKIKTGVLTAAQETQIRELISRMFSTQAAKEPVKARA